MLHEVSVRVKTLRHLPQQFFQDEKERELALSKRQSNASHRHQHGRGHGRGGVDQRRCLRAQASISNETRETGNSVWGRGMRSREAIWLRGVDTLSWSLPEQQFKLVKAYTPVCKVHVYATDASTPTMDTSDAVGWFVVDMRDLAGQRQQERWVKLQGASPAEVLISSSLAMARDRADLPKQKLSSDPTDVPLGFPPSVQADRDATKEDEEKEEVPAQATGTPNPTANPAPATATAPPGPATATATPAPATTTPTPSPATATPTPALATATPPPANPTPTPAGNASRKTIATATATAVATTALPHAEAAQLPAPVTDAEVYRGQENESVAVLTTTAAEAVSDLEALPVGPGADGPEARTFSLSISVKGAAGLSRLVPSVGAADGGGFWFSYSIFGVVVQTDRFERLAAPPPGNGPVLEPMLDSFRLRATLQGLCEFLGEAPPLQVYLCTEGCILAHADIDMARLLPRGEWSTRTTSQFCRTGLEGDFCLRLPGEMTPPPPDQREALEGQRGNAVVTIAAELTRAGATPGDCIRREAGTGAKPGSGGGEAGSPGMRTWAFLAAKRPQGGGGEGVITASLRRLVLRPAARGGDADRLQRVLVGFHGAGESLPPRDTAVGATAAAPQAAGVLGMGKDGSVSLRGFQVVGCNDRGEMDTEDTSLLGNILWKWEGDFPQDDQQLQRGGRPLAKVRVLDDGAGHGEVAAGVVPWPSLARSGRQQVDVKLLSPEGFVIGSCRVCLGVAMGKGVVDVGTDREAVEDGNGSVISEEESKRVGLDGVGQVERVDTPLVGDFLGRVGADAAVSSKGVQAEEAALEGDQKVAGGDVPRSYRLSVNLASVKDLENAAYVVARYHYPYFGTSAPVRTSLVWVAPRMDTPLSNSCCTFSFGMSLDRLSATVHDRKLVVSLRNKDRFKEEEVGLVTLPLEDVVKADPKYFRCRDTNKTFTSITGFRAHLKSRQRAGQISSETASKATPVEVKVLDSYLTVADTRKAKGPGSPADHTGAPARLCSLRAILLLEDMGTTGDPDDKAWLDEEAHYSPHVRIQDGPHLGSPTQAPPSYATDFDGRGATGSARRISEGGVVNLPGEAEGRGAGMDAERARREWEQWRLREETAFAKRLREKDQALEEKWETRESARRRDLMNAQTDYSKLEGKLRKALSEVEARERQLKAREESWRSEHAQKISELQLLQRRLREETKHQVELERMRVKALEKQVSSHAKALEDARARVTATDEDLERFRQQQRRTPEGGLRQEIFRLGAAKAEAEAQVERERSSKNKALLEKEEYRAHIHKLARTIKLHQERESTCARREMEQLRLEYMAREERFHLDGDRNELRSIKQELDELRHVSVVQEAQANLAKVNTGPASTNNENTAPTSASAVDATAPLPSSTAEAGVVGVVRTAPLSGSKAPTVTGLGTSGYPSSRAPTVVGTSGLPTGNYGAPVTTETPYPDPSPSPPPRPTPAPAPATSAVSVRREAGSMSWGSAGQPTGRVGYGGTSQGTDRGGYRGTSILEARGGGSSNVGSVNSRGVHSGSGKNDGGAGVDGSGASDDGEGDVERLVGWRDDLLATGMYTSQNPIVSEMNRRIAEANRRRAEGSQRQE